MKYLIFILGVLFVSKSRSQNIIQNGNLQDTVYGNFGVLYPAKWNSPTSGSPDFLHPLTREPWKAPQTIVGYQDAKVGYGYYGVSVFSLSGGGDRREYIQNELSRPLIKDSTYCLRFYISLADSMQFAIKNDLGVYFSNSKLSSQTVNQLNFTPQIQFYDSTHFTEKKEWVKLEESYIAQGGERYIIIGNFKPDSLLDTLRIEGGNKLEHFHVYYFIDDFWLSHCDSLPEDTAIGLKEVDLNQQIVVYPNPVKDQLFVRYEGHQKLQIKLYNLVGQAVEFHRQEQTDQLQLSIGHLPKGIYFLEIIAAEERISRKIVKQ